MSKTEKPSLFDVSDTGKEAMKWSRDSGRSSKGVTIYELLIMEYEFCWGGGGKSHQYHEDVFDDNAYINTSINIKKVITNAEKIITKLWLNEDYNGYISSTGCQLRRKIVIKHRNKILNCIKDCIDEDFGDMDLETAMIHVIVDCMIINPDEIKPKLPK